MTHIKLTNAHKDHKGKPLILNTEYIASFFPGKNEEDEDIVFAFGVQGNTWHIQESIDEILGKLNVAA